MTTPTRRLTAASLAALLACSAALAQNSTPSASAPSALTQASAPSSVPATPAASTDGVELTLAQCIERALKHNFDLEIDHYNPVIAKDGIEVAKGAFQPVVSVIGSTGQNSIPGANSRSSNLQVGVTQQLYTGTSFSASSQLDRSAINPAVAVLNPAYNADLTLSVRQNLLSGFGTAVNKAPINRARIGLDVANLNYKVTALTVIQNTENAYYNLAFAREQLKVFNSSFELANRLWEEAKIRRQTGVATDLDVLTGEVGVANARRNVILGTQTVKDRQDTLLSLIGQFELDSALGTVRFAEVTDATPIFASSLRMAKENQPDYQASIATIEQLKLDLVVAKDATKPDLSVGAALGLNGTNGSGHDAFSDALDRQGHSWQVDFAFNYPWGQTSNRARYRQSLATLTREQIRLKQIEQNIELQVRTAVRSVETNLENVKIATLAARLSEQQYELEKAKFDAGQSTSYRVLQAQTDLETARVSELQANVNLQAAITGLHRLEGSSLQRYAVNLP